MSDRERSIEQAFRDFHRANPGIYNRLVGMCREARARSCNKVGIGMLFEVLRWDHLVRTNADDFKLNNNHRAYYARLIMERESDLRGIFETRELRAGSGRWLLGPPPAAPAPREGQEALPV